MVLNNYMKKALCFFLKGFTQAVLSIYNTVYGLLEIIFKTDMRNHVKYVKSSNVLYVFANGPSLNDDIKKIDFSKGVFSVVNNFYVSPYFKIIKPQYYIVADPLFFLQNEDVMNVIKDVEWEMTLMVPYSMWKRVEILRNIPNNNVKVIPYHTINYKGFECFRNLLYRKGLSMPKVQNVLVASIFIGINMGYKDIRLFGVDHSWTQTLGVNSMNQVCAVDHHFYDTGEVRYSPYLKNPNTGEMYYLHELLRYFAQMFESYHLLRKYADYRGCRIINCTKDSFIDAFERI